MRRWHHRLGAVLGLVVILFAITGVLLNHSQSLHLDQRLIQSPLLLRWYDIEIPEPVAFAVGDHWVSHWGGNQLYFQEREVSYCEAPMSGAVLWRQQIVVACADGLVLLTAAGEFIERVGSIYQLPLPLTGVAVDGALYLQTPDAVYRADLDAMAWQRVPDTIAAAESVALPAELEAELRGAVAAAELTLERVLADIHSGRILGAAGTWLADIAALGMVFLGFSGLWMWWHLRQRRR